MNFFSSSHVPTSGSIRFLANDSDVRGGALIAYDLLPKDEHNEINANVTLHKYLIGKNSSESVDPLAYFDCHKQIVAFFPQSIQFKKTGIEGASSDSLLAEVENRYTEIEMTLDELRNPVLKADAIDGRAVETAFSIVRQLQAYAYPPPALSWHGGDAVVMLWALGKTTYALTVTDGEVGYVVRSDKKTIRRKDSVLINSFVIENLMS